MVWEENVLRWRTIPIELHCVESEVKGPDELTAYNVCRILLGFDVPPPTPPSPAPPPPPPCYTEGEVRLLDLPPHRSLFPVLAVPVPFSVLLMPCTDSTTGCPAFLTSQRESHELLVYVCRYHQPYMNFQANVPSLSLSTSVHCVFFLPCIPDLIVTSVNLPAHPIR